MTDQVPTASPTAPPRGRERFRPRSRSRWQRIPISVRIVLPVLLIAGALFRYQTWRSGRTLLRFALPKPAAAALPPLQLTLFPEFVTFAQPAPPPPLAELQLQDGGEIAIDHTLVPDTALVRYSGPGIGTGFTRIVRGRQSDPVVLQPPATLTGRVGAPHGFFAFGLRSLGLQPVTGATVQALGGGENGVLLATATTGIDGRFELSGFASGLPVLGLRVLAAGHAMAFVQCQPAGDPPIVPLVPTRAIEGRVVLPAGVDPTPLRVLAKGLAGVEAGVGADGSFRLDHVAPNLQPRLLLYGLPAGFTHRLSHGAPGDTDVHIEVLRAARLRGHVVDRLTQQPLAGALVWHENGPAGWVQTEADGNGAFELGLVPPGRIEVRAQHTLKDELGNEDTITGVRSVDVEEGAEVGDILVRLD